MSIKKKFVMLFVILIVGSMLLAACETNEGNNTAADNTANNDEPAANEPAADEPVADEPVADEPAADTGGPAFKNADTYVVATIGDQETLDPAWTYETAGSAIENNIYEGMVWFNRDRTDEFVPILSTSWEINDAGDVWTFQIREGVTFHEGGTLEPHDVAYSMQRALLQDRIDGPHWMTLEAFFAEYAIHDIAMGISGAETFEDVSDADLVATCEMVKAAVVADDDAGTVTYTLAQPTPWFLAMMANSFMGAVTDMEWMVEQGAWDGDCATWVAWNDPAAEDTVLFNEANGTGPYKLDHWTPGEETVLVANENYWRQEGDPVWEGGPSGVASIPTVTILSVDEWGTRLAMFEAGDADYIYVPSQYRPQVEEFYGATCDSFGACDEMGGWIQAFVKLPQLAMTPAQFNWQINSEGGNIFMGSGELDGNGIPDDFFQDLHIRKAFNYCFDFDTMISDALNGEGIQSQGPIIAGMLGYREGEAPLYSFDLAKCEEEFKLADLDHDGIPAGEDDEGDVWSTGFYMQMGFNTGNDTRRLASEILKYGLESVNDKFAVTVVGMPWPVLLNTRRSGKLPIYVGGWLEDFHDPHNWVHPFLHSGGAYGRVVNMPEATAAEFDAMIEEAASLTSAEERRVVYEAIQLKAQTDAVMIWLYQAVGRIHLQNWVTGWYYNPAYSAAAYSYAYALSKAP